MGNTVSPTSIFLMELAEVMRKRKLLRCPECGEELKKKFSNNVYVCERCRLIFFPDELKHLMREQIETGRKENIEYGLLFADKDRELTKYDIEYDAVVGGHKTIIFNEPKHPIGSFHCHSSSGILSAPTLSLSVGDHLFGLKKNQEFLCIGRKNKIGKKYSAVCYDYSELTPEDMKKMRSKAEMMDGRRGVPSGMMKKIRKYKIKL